MNNGKTYYDENRIFPTDVKKMQLCARPLNVLARCIEHRLSETHLGEKTARLLKEYLNLAEYWSDEADTDDADELEFLAYIVSLDTPMDRLSDFLEELFSSEPNSVKSLMLDFFSFYAKSGDCINPLVSQREKIFALSKGGNLAKVKSGLLAEICKTIAFSHVSIYAECFTVTLKDVEKKIRAMERFDAASPRQAKEVNKAFYELAGRSVSTLKSILWHYGEYGEHENLTDLLSDDTVVGLVAYRELTSLLKLRKMIKNSFRSWWTV